MRFAPPDVPATAVARDRLVALLEASARRPLTIVAAPPGAGKTVLLAQWAASPRHRATVRWLTLERAHNDGSHFTDELHEMLAPRAPAAPAARAGAPAHDLAATLLDDLVGLPPTTLVLDDFHALEEPASLDALATVLEHAPRSLHVVVATRVDPPIRFSRLHLSDAVVEVRQDDLAFTRGEAAVLVRRVSGREVGDAQVDALVARTEGWAAGLQLAAVALREQHDVERFAETFAADVRHVADYLTEEVLRQQPEPVRTFLLQTSVLDRMSGSLCDVVTAGTGGQAMLEQLERTSMFVARPGPGREWFRYHGLFRAMLRLHLRAEAPELEPTLLRRAAEWHLARVDLEPGVRYLVEAGAWGDVIHLAFRYGDMLLRRGEAPTVARWIEQVPGAIRRERTDARLLEAAALVVDGDARAAGAALEDLATLRSPAERLVADLLRSHWSLQSGDSDEAVAGADRVLEELEEVAVSALPDVLGLVTSRSDVVAGARLAQGVGLMQHGRMAAARARLENAAEAGHALWQVRALAGLALVDAWSGRLSSSEQLAARALALADQVELEPHWFTADALLARVHVALERDDLERSAALLADVTRRADPHRGPITTALAETERALLDLAADRPADGLATLAAQRARDTRRPPPLVGAHRTAVEARLLIAVGDLEGAAHALERAPASTADVAAARVRLLVERDDLQAARRLVDGFPSEPQPRARLERLLWSAVLAAVDDDEAGRACLAPVVTEAAAERHLGLFRSAGHHVLGPARALYRATPSPFLRAVVEHLSIAQGRRVRSADGLVEQLTERELTVLGLLPTRLSNEEIASRLGISLNTVKTHLKHIYQKLGVAGRSEAVAAGEGLGLL